MQPSEKKPGLWRRLGGMLRAGWNWLSKKASEACSQIGQASRNCGNWIATGAANVWTWMRSMASGVWVIMLLIWASLCRFRTPLVVALGVGLVVGLGCYFARPVVASTISGLAGFAGSLAALSPQKS